MQMRRDLGVNGEPARASVGEVVEVLLRLDDHQMDVDRQRREPSYRLDHLRAEGEVRNEAAIHHVDVNDVRAAGLAARDLVAESGEVRAENGRGDASTRAVHGEIVIDTFEPGATRLPAAGVCEMTVWPVAVESESVVTSPTCSPICSSMARADAYDCPTTSGAFTAGGPLLTTTSTRVDGATKVPAAGFVDSTAPRADWLSCCCTSPTSSPAFSIASSAVGWARPTTDGTCSCRCPALTSSTISLPRGSVAPGGGDCASTVDFGA